MLNYNQQTAMNNTIFQQQSNHSNEPLVFIKRTYTVNGITYTEEIIRRQQIQPSNNNNNNTNPQNERLNFNRSLFSDVETIRNNNPQTLTNNNQNHESFQANSIPLEAIFNQFFRSNLTHPNTQANNNTMNSNFFNILIFNHNDPQQNKKDNRDKLNKLKVRTIKDDITIDDKTNCVICLNDYVDGDEVYDLKCNHSYHKKCLEEWFKENNSCPTCRRTVD